MVFPTAWLPISMHGTSMAQAFFCTAKKPCQLLIVPVFFFGPFFFRPLGLITCLLPIFIKLSWVDDDDDKDDGDLFINWEGEERLLIRCFIFLFLFLVSVGFGFILIPS